MKQCDVLIIGTGIAGLTLALQLIKQNAKTKIILVAKGDAYETNTSLAQGGLAVVCNQLTDSFESHIEDTLAAGQGKCNPKVVEHVVREAPERLKELLEWGADFDVSNQGQLNLALEGGHSHHRVVHHKDKTGWHIQEILINKIKKYPTVEVIEQAFAVDLIKAYTPNEHAVGITFFDQNHTFSILYASHIVLATGGSGQIFQYTSNPSLATGDGVAIAIRAGVKVEDLNYIQFHPTALYEPDKENLFLISEALRGFGAKIVNAKQERFLFQYDSRGELATRDIVSNAIATEMGKTNVDFVYLDIRHLNISDFEFHFPTLSGYFKKIGLKYAEELIPIVPAAHYQCGGITVDENGQTSLKALYALGECSCTGLHGANRLASNSLIEALVFAYRLASYIQKIPPREIKPFPFIPFEKSETIHPEILFAFKHEIKLIMHYNLLQSPLEIQKEKMRHLKKLHTDLIECFGYYNRCKESCELENMLIVSLEILEQNIAHARSNNSFIKTKPLLYFR